jgi:C-terminal processing protease CtpA/Prc
MTIKHPFKLALSAFLIIGISTLQSCKKDEIGINEPLPGDNKENQRIYDLMSHWYLWNEHIPDSYTKTYNTREAKEYFQSLLYNYGDTYGDRFSYIEENSDYSGSKASYNSESDTGFGITYKYSKTSIVQTDNSSSTHYIYFIYYVFPDSPAAKAGLKRGDIIYKINDKYIDSDDALKGLSSVKIKYTQLSDKEILLKDTDPTAQLSVAQYPTKPIWASKIITDNNKKIGYLCYKSFSSNSQDLINEFSKFRKEGISELVLDLRYNSGGLLNMAQFLGSLIIPKDKLGSTFIQQVCNKKLNNTKDINLTLKTSTNSTVTNNKIEIERLYVLTSGVTASASETIILCTKPYLKNVYVIGYTTRGKNQSAVELKDKNSKWILHPIVARIYDCNMKTFSETGITPDFKINEDLNMPYKELGDTEEPLLQTALHHIKNGSFPATSKGSVNTDFGQLIINNQDKGGNILILNNLE